MVPVAPMAAMGRRRISRRARHLTDRPPPPLRSHQKEGTQTLSRQRAIDFSRQSSMTRPLRNIQRVSCFTRLASSCRNTVANTTSLQPSISTLTQQRTARTAPPHISPQNASLKRCPTLRPQTALSPITLRSCTASHACTPILGSLETQ